MGGEKKNTGPTVYVDRSTRVQAFRAVCYLMGRSRSDGDPQIHSGVEVVTTNGNHYFVGRNSNGTVTQDVREWDYTDIWRIPRWTTTIDDLKRAGDSGGSFCMRSDNCLHATQRMVRQMGQLEELYESCAKLPPDLYAKLKRYRI